MQLNTSRNANELKTEPRSRNVSAPQTRHCCCSVLSISSWGLTSGHKVVAPTGLSASSVTSNSVTLRWTDASSNERQEVRQPQSATLVPAMPNIATLTAYSTQYTDSNRPTQHDLLLQSQRGLQEMVPLFHFRSARPSPRAPAVLPPTATTSAATGVHREWRDGAR